MTKVFNYICVKMFENLSIDNILWLSDNVPCDVYQHQNIRKLQRSFLAMLIKQLENRFWESNYIYQSGLLDLL
jgi:hypothetical protein